MNALGILVGSLVAIAQATVAQLAPAPRTISVHVAVLPGKASLPAVSVEVHGPNGTVLSRKETDGNGIAEFQVEAGTYFVVARAEGYLFAGSTAIGAPDPRLGMLPADVRDVVYRRIELIMVRPSAIRGEVTDNRGAVGGVLVQLAQTRTLSNGQALLVPLDAIPSTVTDADGRFVVSGLVPGEYYVLAVPPPFGGRSKIKPPAGPSGFYVTFFPGTESALSAQPVRLEPGTDKAILLPLVSADMRTISGRMLDEETGLPASGTVRIMRTEHGTLRAFVPAEIQTSSEGRFEFQSVPPGDYSLQGLGSQLFGTAMVAVDNQVTDVKLVLRKARTASGRLTFEGNASVPPPSQVRIQVVPADMSSLASQRRPFETAVISDDWSFEVHDLMQKGTLSVVAPPPWRLVKAVVGVTDIRSGIYDFSQTNTTGINVVLSSKVGSLTGSIMNGGSPVARGVVLLFPEDASARPPNGSWIRTAVSNGDGQYSIAGIAPGRYLAVALTAPPTASPPALVASLQSFAVSVVIAEGATSTLNLTAVVR
jgi:hypothetical protein